MRHALTSPAARGLFRAIVEDPADDVPRLLLADVLEEAGDPRGEFIRVQCELANEPPGFVEAVERSCKADGFLCQCRMCSRRRKEQELLESASGKSYHCWEWMGETVRAVIPDGAYWHNHVTFRRGFVASVTLTCADWCGAECPCYWTEQNSDGTCSRCHGTGRTGRHGPTLVLAAPIEEVVLSDREPEFYQDWGGQRYLWHRSVGNARSDVPPCLYDRMDETVVLGRADALASLSHAALTWARQEAGLPALTF